MIEPVNYVNEVERIKELESYSILDTLSEDDFDNLTAIAAEICNTPISLVSLVDTKRQWFKSHHGLDVQETARKHALCAHAINDSKHVFIVQDARKDERFHDNPLVTKYPFVTFYAGVPLLSPNGMPLGTLCVIDKKPRLLSKSQINSLKALSNQVMNLLALRKSEIEKEKAIVNLEKMNLELQRFAVLAAHDIKSPLNNIAHLTSILKKDHAKGINKEGQQIVNMVESSCLKLKDLVDGLLDYSRSDNVTKEEKSKVNLLKLKKDIEGLFIYDHEILLEVKSNLLDVFVNKTALEQILINLVANAIKYNDRKTIKIVIGVNDLESFYEFYVEDNGWGIDESHLDMIFEIFETVGVKKDRNGHTGNGIGLATVKKVVETFGGNISVESQINKGSKFIFTFAK